MPMFDDPRKELQRMEEELLSAEFEEEFDEDDEFDEEGAPLRRRNPAVDFQRTMYDDEEFDEDAAVLAEEPSKKGPVKMLILVILELLIVLGVIGWCVGWLG